MTEATQRTSDSGVSIWLDDLSRTRIESGNLQELIKDKNVVGVTTNPSIFQKALSQVGPYDAQLKELGKVDVETAVRELTTTDVRNATDIFREIAEATDFVDGRVSIEVDPRLAHETEATEQQAVELWEGRDRRLHHRAASVGRHPPNANHEMWRRSAPHRYHPQECPYCGQTDCRCQ